MTEATFRVDVTKQQFVFSAAHFITFAGDICERIHGHNYGVRASVSGPLDENRYVVDFIPQMIFFKRMKKKMGFVTAY